MKKVYKKPLVKVKSVTYHQPLLGESDRSTAGGPNDEGLPSGVGETGDDTDPYGGHGQGSGGGGNRSKWYNGWDY